MDIFTKEKRSEIMSKIRSKNTKPERIVFSYLRKQGIYFQRHYARAPGKPDIALPRKKIAVFIDGDFWHGRKYSRLNKKLSTFWREKIKKNIDRDRKNRKRLRYMGWKILYIWESNIFRDPNVALPNIANFLLEEK